MKLALKIIALALLLFNGAGAIYGGLSLIIYPDGSAMHLPMDLLEYSFFDSYLIPGIVLFIANGILSLYVFASVLFGHNHYWRLVVIQGIVLIAWLIIQIAMIHVLDFLHLAMFCTGIGLISIGVFADNFVHGRSSHEIA